MVILPLYVVGTRPCSSYFAFNNFFFHIHSSLHVLDTVSQHALVCVLPILCLSSLAKSSAQWGIWIINWVASNYVRRNFLRALCRKELEMKKMLGIFKDKRRSYHRSRDAENSGDKMPDSLTSCVGSSTFSSSRSTTLLTALLETSS